MSASTKVQADSMKMNEATLLVSPGPHRHSQLKTQFAMFAVIATLLPVAGIGVYLFGLPALNVIIVATVFALITEALCQWVRKRPLTLANGSAALTGLLLALTLPPATPLWMTALGSIVAIGLGKHAFGGLGANPFNPALVGRAFLSVSFAAPLSTFHAPFDGVTGATPLQTINATGAFNNVWSLFTGITGGSIGETAAIALILGGIVLVLFEIIDWRIPVGMMGSMALIALIVGHSPLVHLLSGGVLIGAIYMATDWVTSPITRKGKWIFAVGIGVITMVIRLYTQMPEGVSFAILIMNGMAPLLNTITRPKGRLKGPSILQTAVKGSIIGSNSEKAGGKNG